MGNSEQRVTRLTVPRKGKMVCLPPHRDRTPARIAAREDYPQPGLWQQFSYNADGDLMYRGHRALDWVEKYDAPLSVIDSGWVRLRTHQLHNLLDDARLATHYSAGARVYYAAKARMHAGIVLPAYQAGALGETSSVQDLLHIELLWRRRMLPRNFKTICNGFKLPPERLIDRVPGKPFSTDEPVYTPLDDYAGTIMRMLNAGLPIMPIIDSLEEAAWFMEHAPRKGMEVGARLAFGKVREASDIDILNAGFGLTPRQTEKLLRQLAHHPRTTPRMLHAMVGAAETMPIHELVDGARLAAELYFRYKRVAPTLDTLNFGGGLPPLGESYDHLDLFCSLFSAIQQEAKKAGFDDGDLPVVAFEPGSLIAAESTFLIVPVLNIKTLGHVGGAPILFGVSDVSFIESTIDGLLLGHDFPMLPANFGNRRSYPMWLRGVTCDSMDVWPPMTIERPWLRLPVPARNEKLYIVAAQVGAYQESLTGKGGVNHCAVKEPAEVIIDGAKSTVLPGTSAEDKLALMGYTRDVLGMLGS